MGDFGSKVSNWVKITVSVMGLAFVLGVLKGFLRPLYVLYKIRGWLRTESDYVEDYSYSGFPPFYFEYTLNLYGEGEDQITIRKEMGSSALHIRGEYEFEASRILALDERDNERRLLQQTIETVLASTPGVYQYTDDMGNRSDFQGARFLVVQYSIYRDGLTQHELMNGILDIASAFRFTNRQLKRMQDNLSDQS